MSAYTDFIDRVVTKYHLSSTDIDATTSEKLFNKVMADYSRSFGLRAFKQQTYSAGVNEYELPAECHHVLYALWNDSSPEAVLTVTTTLTAEAIAEFWHHPTLRVIDYVKRTYNQTLRSEDEQIWEIYRTDTDGTKRMITLDPTPTTDIYIVYRKLHTKDTYPQEHESIFGPLFEALILRHCQSTGLVVTIGDVTYDHARLDRLIAQLEGDYYLHCAGGSVGVS